MRGMKTQTTPKHKTTTEKDSKKPVMPTQHELLMRREPNHNIHVITHHGKIQVGRKGRTT